MRLLEVFGAVFALLKTAAAQTVYCGDCGCFGAAEYASLLAQPVVTVTVPPLSTTAFAPLSPSPSFETVTDDGVTFAIGASQAIVSGTTYAIGPGATPVTAYLQARLFFRFGPGGVGTPDTTFSPYNPATTAASTTTSLNLGNATAQTTSVGTIGNVVANSSVTLLVPPPATANPTSTAELSSTVQTSTSYSSGASTDSVPPQGGPGVTNPATATATSSSSSTVIATTSIYGVISVSSSSSPQTSNTASVPSSAIPVERTDLDPAFINTMLQYTNQYRNVNQASDVTWDPVKAQYAQLYANNCTFKHSGGPFGENLAIGGFSSPEYYVWLWYNEIQLYTNYTHPNLTNFESWGHFTQLVWDNTMSIGCGYATYCGNSYGDYYLVCEYDTGNVVASGGSDPAIYFEENVLTPLSPEPAAPTGFDSAYPTG